MARGRAPAATPRTARGSPSRRRCSSRSRCCAATVRLLHVRQAARAPRASPYLALDEVLDIARRGAALGCHEALFTLGEAPEARYPAAAEWLAAHGYASTVDYLVAAAARGARRDRAAPPRQRRRARAGRPRAAARGVAVAGDDDRDARRAPRRAGRPARRRARQDARAPAGDARRRGPRPRSRSPPASSSASARPAPSGSTRSLAIADVARAPRPRAGGDRPELPAQAGHRDVAARRLRSRRVPLDHRRRP